MRTLLRNGFIVLLFFLIEFSALFVPFEKIPRGISLIFSSREEQQDAQIRWLQRDVDYARFRMIEKENTELRDQLAFRERTTYERVFARRIGRSTDPVHSKILVDRGANDGITKGDPAIAGDGILVGTVSSVEPRRSYILPLTDPASKILASILQEKEEVRGIAEGQFNIGLTMTLIPISAQLKENDLVVTSGFQDRIPPGLVIGTVQNIQRRPEDLFQQAVLKIPRVVDDTALMTVLILK